MSDTLVLDGVVCLCSVLTKDIYVTGAVVLQTRWLYSGPIIEGFGRMASDLRQYLQEEGGEESAP